MSSKKILLLIASGVLAALLIRNSVKLRRRPKQRPAEQTEYLEPLQSADETVSSEVERQDLADTAGLDAMQPAETEAQNQPPEEPAPSPESTAKTPEQTVVMVTDDSKVVRVKTGRLLSAHNYLVVMAEDGLDAVRQIENALPDLLITDLDMPGMGGMELVRHLRRLERTIKLPIIMITADGEALRKEAHESGVNVVLGKPYPEEQLIAQIQLLMSGRNAE